jgi:hypothetical protein
MPMVLFKKSTRQDILLNRTAPADKQRSNTIEYKRRNRF